MDFVYLWLFVIAAFYVVYIICSCWWNGYRGFWDWYYHEIQKKPGAGAWYYRKLHKPRRRAGD